MKRIYVTQRVDIIADYGERRDALDQRWTCFLRKTGAIPLPVPNDRQSVSDMLKSVRFDGILLTGGNSPAEYGGNAPERDETDELLLNYAVEQGIPLIGVCRGMQSILLYFGGSLIKTDNHIAIRHEISGRIQRTVNSYHSLAAASIPSGFEVLALSSDGSAEAIKHTSFPMLALMWHPERENEFANDDVDLFHNIWFGKDNNI